MIFFSLLLLSSYDIAMGKSTQATSVTIDWGEIAEKLIILGLGALGAKAWKLIRDMDAAFCRLRRLEREVFGDRGKEP
jgi:hypothetical protein